ELQRSEPVLPVAQPRSGKRRRDVRRLQRTRDVAAALDASTRVRQQGGQVLARDRPVHRHLFADAAIGLEVRAPRAQLELRERERAVIEAAAGVERDRLAAQASFGVQRVDAYSSPRVRQAAFAAHRVTAAAGPVWGEYAGVQPAAGAVDAAAEHGGPRAFSRALQRAFQRGDLDGAELAASVVARARERHVPVGLVRHPQCGVEPRAIVLERTLHLEASLLARDARVTLERPLQRAPFRANVHARLLPAELDATAAIDAADREVRRQPLDGDQLG